MIRTLHPYYPWIAAAGVALAAGAVFAPLPMAALLVAGALIFFFLRHWPTSGMVMLIFAALLSYFKLDIGPVTVRAEHVAVLLLAALLAWQIVFHRRPFRLDTPALFALAWWGLNVVAAFFFAPDLSDSLRHLFRLALMVAAYIVGINLLRTPEQWWAAFAWFLGLGLAEALFGLIARGLYPFGVNLGVQIAWILTEPVPHGTLEEGNLFGSHAAAWLIACAALFLAQPRLRTRWRLPLLAGLVITAAAVALSLSRGAWVALLAGLGLLYVFYGPRSRGQYVRGTLLICAAPLVVGGLVLLIQALPADIPLIARLQTFLRLATDATLRQRLGDADLALLNWAERPWLGWGPGSFYQLHGVRNWEPAWIASQSVRTLQETGVLGLLTYGGFVATLLWQAVKGIRRAASLRAHAALAGLTIGFVVLQIAYQATDGTWLAAVWVQAALLTTVARLTSRQIGKPQIGKPQIANSKSANRQADRSANQRNRATRNTQSAIRNPQSAIRNPQSAIHPPSATRILFVHSSDELYGSDVVLLELLRRLDRSRFAPLVALPADLPYDAGRPRLSDELAKLDIPLCKLDFAVLRRRYLRPAGLPGFALRLYRGSRALARLIRDQDVRLVHANTVAVVGGALAARLARRPLVWHVHEIIERPAWLRWLLVRLATGWAERVVAISGPVAEHLLARGATRDAAARVSVIHDAVDTEHFNPQNDGAAARAAWGLGPQHLVVGWRAGFTRGRGKRYW